MLFKPPSRLAHGITTEVFLHEILYHAETLFSRYTKECFYNGKN
nr:MAG TPA: hypothetical protein [Bacteriophage sp.]